MLYITLSAGFITMYFDNTEDRYLKVPAGHFIIYAAKNFDADPDTLIIKHTDNNSAVTTTHVKTSEIATPAIGANTYEAYLGKLVQYLNGDAAVVF